MLHKRLSIRVAAERESHWGWENNRDIEILFSLSTPVSKILDKELKGIRLIPSISVSELVDQSLVVIGRVLPFLLRFKGIFNFSLVAFEGTHYQPILSLTCSLFLFGHVLN